jgi:hypothetical protein
METIMAEKLGPFLIEVLLLLLGIFLMLAAYSRKPLLLKLATLGTIHIDPDSPGRRQRAVVFGIGIALVLVAIAFIILDKVHLVRAT